MSHEMEDERRTYTSSRARGGVACRRTRRRAEVHEARARLPLELRERRRRLLARRRRPADGRRRRADRRRLELLEVGRREQRAERRRREGRRHAIDRRARAAADDRRQGGGAARAVWLPVGSGSRRLAVVAILAVVASCGRCGDGAERRVGGRRRRRWGRRVRGAVWWGLLSQPPSWGNEKGRRNTRWAARARGGGGVVWVRAGAVRAAHRRSTRRKAQRRADCGGSATPGSPPIRSRPRAAAAPATGAGFPSRS